jgi:hypothetical protein
MVIVPITRLNKNDIFRILIEIMISLARFSDGGAAIFAEIIINHINIIGGWAGAMFLFIKILRELLFM